MALIPFTDASSARMEAIAKDKRIGDIEWAGKIPGAAHSFFDAPSGPLAMVEMGDPSRERVVLLPGVTGSKEDFRLMLPLLVEAGYYVQSVDLAGQYESCGAGPGAGKPYTYELYCADVRALLESGGPAHLLGYSFAGIVAQMTAVRHPELVRSLTLLTTPPTSGNVFASMRVLGPFAPLVDARRGAALMIWGIRTNKNRVPPRRLAFVRARFDLTVRRSVDEILGLMMRAPELGSQLRGTGIPILVAASNHDLWSSEAHRRFAAHLGADFRLYDTGHSPCETTPHQLCLDLVEMYRSVRA